MSKIRTNSGPIFWELLAVAFITLKLIGYIQWSWWWVLAPIWIPLVIVGFVTFVITVSRRRFP